MQVPRKVVLCDVEGCLTYDARTYDHDVFAMVRQLNRAATPTNAVPYLTVCTGRPSAFVEAFCAMLEICFPAICEGGCGLYLPLEDRDHDRQLWHPMLVDGKSPGAIQTLTAATLSLAREAGLQTQLKQYLLSFTPGDETSVEDLRRYFADGLAARDLAAEVTRSATSVDISPLGVTKGSAVRWLLDVVERRYGWALASANLVGVGDSLNDLSFLEVVGHSVAPANADAPLPDAVDSPSPYTDARAVAHTLLEALRYNTAQHPAPATAN